MTKRISSWTLIVVLFAAAWIGGARLAAQSWEDALFPAIWFVIAFGALTFVEAVFADGYDGTNKESKDE